jgi:hypothetical protein
MKIRFIYKLIFFVAIFLIMTPAFTEAQDVTYTVDGHTVNVDIDKMYSKWMGGTAIEFASGYEGLGKSGSSGFYSFYRINSSGSGVSNSTDQVGAIYKYVPK